MWGTFGAVWGIAGIVLLLVKAIYRLTPISREAFAGPLGWGHWLFVAAWVALMLWSEAYRGFHCQFNPRVVARALYLREHPSRLRVALAPLFCLAIFGAERRRIVASVALLAGIVALVLLVGLLPQPWRGLIDLGVVLGLLGGLVSLAYFVVQALRPESFPYPHEVPEPATRAG